MNYYITSRCGTKAYWSQMRETDSKVLKAAENASGKHIRIEIKEESS